MANTNQKTGHTHISVRKIFFGRGWLWANCCQRWFDKEEYSNSKPSGYCPQCHREKLIGPPPTALPKKKEQQVIKNE
jgi:hypothetical protein